MFERDRRSDWDRWRHPHNPADTIAVITAAATSPPASSRYRRLMTVIDADLYTRPDYPDLEQLAQAIVGQHTRNRRQP